MFYHNNWPFANFIWLHHWTPEQSTLTTGHHQAASQTNQTIQRNITWKRTFTGDCWLWEPGVPVLSEWLSPVLCWPCSARLVTPPGGLLSTIAMLLTASLPGFLLYIANMIRTPAPRRDTLRCCVMGRKMTVKWDFIETLFNRILSTHYGKL